MSENSDADYVRRDLQQLLSGTGSTLMSTGMADIDHAVEEDDDYETTTEEETDDRLHDFFEQLIEEEEDDREDSDSGTDDEYYDAEEDTIEGGDNAVQEHDIEDLHGVPAVQIFYLWARGQLMLRGTHDDDDEYGGNYPLRRRRAPRERPDPNRFPKIPSDKGAELMGSGDFGTNEIQATSTIRQQKKLAKRILSRELGLDGGARHKANQNLIAQGMIPSSNADTIIHYDSPVYSGQFSDDGNFFFACVKDYKVRMYDTSNPYKWRYYKTVNYPFGHWTLTDASLSPDNRYLAYTSICPTVCLAPTDPNDLGDPYQLDLSDNGSRGRAPGNFRSRGNNFGIWSIRFSGDGRELVAGTSSNSILVYDIESRRSILEVTDGHDDEVNAVCFADKSSSNIIFSGSDDSTIKVWDRRSMGDSREAGAFVGHIEGITYIDSKGDGRYCLSNGKDQSMKLWDLRTMMTTSRFAQVNRPRQSNFDYRWGNYNDDDWVPHPHDNSVVTFRGHHKILRTLIRCHFSPPGSSNSRYVYTGSEDGSVYVYGLDGVLVKKIDVLEATKDSRPYDAGSINTHYDDDGDRHSKWRTCVRDASWHPNAPVIAASAWNGYGMSTGTVTVHSWNDGAEDDEAEPKMGVRVNDQLIDDPSYYHSARGNPARRSERMVW